MQDMFKDNIHKAEKSSQIAQNTPTSI